MAQDSGRDAYSALERKDDRAGLRQAVLHYWFGLNPPPVFSLPEQIALELSTRILSLEIAPGERILEQEIAVQFCVSRGPVREALRILEREKLITMNARKGCIVTTLSEEEVYDLFEVRAALGSLAARRLASKRSEEAIAILDSLVGVGTKAAQMEDGSRRYVELVFEHGLQLTEAVGSSTISQLMASLALQTMRYSRLGLSSKRRIEESLKLWQAERTAIAAGDVEAAGQAAIERINRSRDEAMRHLSRAAGGAREGDIGSPSH